ncbi:MAG TPA: helix-turn-helix transcriptional regulator [Streptosporangiaceae bacterium]|nr:helix-turn-helix transcriptional regulator [Streptosporangiaceae bacterium]
MFDPAVTGPGEGRQRPRPLLRTMLGEVLRRTRLEQDRTLADVARAARVSMPYLSEVERGRKEVSSEILAAICDALHIDLSDLLAEVGSDLAGARVSPSRVVRLEAITSRQAPDRAGGAGDVMCLLAA